MKTHVALLILALCLLPAVAAGAFADGSVCVILEGASGPLAVPVTPASLLEHAVDLSGRQEATVEGALRVLVGGMDGHPSYFPRGTVVDFIDADVTGYVLALTFGHGFSDRADETLTDPMMHALAQTMQSIGGDRAVRVMVRDDRSQEHIPIGQWFQYPEFLPHKPYESRPGKSGPPGFGQPHANGFLSGKSIFLSPGHGWYYHDSSGAWLTQRGNTNGIVEDLSNAESVLQFLVPYFANSGAGVYTMREMDLNTETTVIDNLDAGFSTTGLWWSSSSTAGYYGSDYMVASVSLIETATATFTADVPADGLYHVYLWYTGGSNRSQDCRIRVHHADGESLVVQNLRRDGFTWKDLGRYYFRASDPPEKRKVVISNQGADPSTFVIADAVRFGGGLHAESGKPRWEMSGMYHATFMGCPQCVTNTVTTMPLYTQWEHEAGWEDGIYLSWHTNAPNPGTGTSSFAYASGGWDAPFNGVSGSLNLRAAIHNELIDDIRAGWDAGWSDRGQHTNWYGEINPNYNNETPGIVFEVAFHDTPDDAEQLKEPLFRQLAAKAVYQGTVRYFAVRDGLQPAFLPEPPREPTVQWDDGYFTVSWLAPDFDGGGLLGDPADGYRVYLGESGKGFGDAIVADKTFVSIPAFKGKADVTYFRFSATNAGGESFPTETLVASSGNGPRVLIVNGFDRIDKWANVPESYYGGGTIYRGTLARMNTYDYVIAHARAIAAAGVDFDSASSEAVISEAIDLAQYRAVVWISGEESTYGDSLNVDEQTLLADYLDGGGALFVSGSEIGWDLWELGDAADRDFYTDYLRAQYLADSSDIGDVTPSGMFSDTAPFLFDYDDYQIYAAYYPDCLAAYPDGSADMTYTGTGLGAAVAADTGLFRVVYLGFPFETIYDPTAQDTIMDAAMDFLLADDDDDDDDDDNDDVDDDDTIDDDDDNDDNNDSADDDDDDDDDDNDSFFDDDDDDTAGGICCG